MNYIKLIITKYPGDYLSIIESNYKNNDIVWLQLWPVVNTKEIEKEFPKVEVIKSIDFISNEDHFRIANEVTEISNNWWDLLSLKKHGDEWNIDGLKITQIFSYEMELVLTNIMFHILAVNRTIKKFKPLEVLFIDRKGERFPSNEILDEFINFSLFPFYRKQFAKDKIKQILLVETANSKLQSTLSKLKNIFSKNPVFLLQKVKQRIIKPSLSNNNIIISNTNRCLHKFEEIAKNYHQIFILDDSTYVQSKNTISLVDFSQEIFFDGISLSPFLKKIVPLIENKWYNLQKYYKKNIELAKIYNPLMYITVNMASSIELVKLWAYKQTGIRTVLGSEGLGQPDKQFDVVMNSVFHPEIEIERWVASSFFAKTFEKNNRDIIITGYLDANINSNSVVKKSKQRKKVIVFALSLASTFVRRAITKVDIFEILQSVTDVARAVSEFSEVELIIKLHPGDDANIPLYKESSWYADKVKIVSHGNLNSIINKSDLVIIYDTSVGLESLIKNKNVISYNYTNRPSYITSIYDFVNHDPERGAALLMAHNFDELKISIKKLLPFGDNTKSTSGFEYVLENMREGYSVNRIVKSLIGNE